MGFNGNRPLWFDSPEIGTHVRLERFFRIQNNGAIWAAPKNDPMPKVAPVFQVPLDGEKRQVWKGLP